MGVQFFKGKFYKCVDKDGDMLTLSVLNVLKNNVRLNIVLLIIQIKKKNFLLQINETEKSVCCRNVESKSFSWINTTPNFDNVIEGYLSLFQIVSWKFYI
jgi:hypothetical protein